VCLCRVKKNGKNTFFRGLVRFGFVGIGGFLVFVSFLGDQGLNPGNAGSLYFCQIFA
jgi:hypothetical protein